MALTIRSIPHPFLELGAFIARFDKPLGEIATHATIDVPAFQGDPKQAVRDLLRHGGFKPAGRSKPASEYLVAAKADGRWPAINALVDACNLASLYSGLPISVVDLDRVVGDLAIKIAPPGTTYVFNPSGQVIDASGLVCLYDEEGPTGTPVKDAQRTKSHEGTRNALAIVWGTNELPGRTAATTRYFRELLAPVATLDDVVTSAS